jgi:hypothetical protein
VPSLRWRLAANLAFTIAEGILLQGLNRLGVKAPTGANLSEDLGCYRRAELAMALVKGSDRAGELGSRGAFEQIAEGSGLEGMPDIFVFIKGREHQDADPRIAIANRFRGLNSIADRHAQIHQNNIGLELAGLVDRLLAVVGLADDRQIIFKV